jgi:hypothetical protein
MLSLMASGAILFPAGGLDIPNIGGQKWLRRFLLPVVWALILFFAHILWWKIAIVMVGSMVAFHLPYGSKTPYWLKFLVGVSFILPTLALGLTIWQIITPITFIVMFRLSNWKPLAGEFAWTIVCFLTGGLIGVTLAQLIQ